MSVFIQFLKGNLPKNVFSDNDIKLRSTFMKGIYNFHIYCPLGASPEEQMWTNLPVITFQKFDVITGDHARP